jgi:hypothetical protein
VSISGPAARLALGVFAGALSLASLASCATFDDADNVAKVNGTALSEETFADMLDSKVAATLLGSGPIDGVMAGDGARSLIGAWIALNAIDDAGLVDQAGHADAVDQVSAQFGEDWNSAPDELRDIAVLNGVLNAMVQGGELTEADLPQALADADVTVSPRYGRWDRTVLRVEPLG